VETVNPPVPRQEARPSESLSAGQRNVNKMSRQEKEDRLVDRLVNLANTLHRNPEYRNSVMYMANSMEKLKTHALTQKQEAKAARQKDKAREPTSSKEQHKQEAQMNTKQFVENWIGDDYSLDRLLTQINFLYEQSRQDPELRALLNDWKQWSTATVKDSSYVEDRERVRRDVKDLIHRTRLVMNGPYREQVNILRREVVYINTGCVHWVQAAGWCNNVAWNTGPLTHRQYVAAIERYEWNKSQRYQSIVAMVYLTWNMAQNIQVSDPDLYVAMKTTLMRSLQQSVLMKQFALQRNIPVRFHGHGPNEPVNYCLVCEEEVFNIFFVKEHEKKHVVHCLRCARQLSKDDFTNWICLEEYEIDHLKNIFDNFVLGGGIQQTQENPLQLALVNNNSDAGSVLVKKEVL